MSCWFLVIVELVKLFQAPMHMLPHQLVRCRWVAIKWEVQRVCSTMTGKLSAVSPAVPRYARVTQSQNLRTSRLQFSAVAAELRRRVVQGTAARLSKTRCVTVWWRHRTAIFTVPVVLSTQLSTVTGWTEDLSICLLRQVPKIVGFGCFFQFTFCHAALLASDFVLSYLLFICLSHMWSVSFCVLTDWFCIRLYTCQSYHSNFASQTCWRNPDATTVIEDIKQVAYKNWFLINIFLYFRNSTRCGHSVESKQEVVWFTIHWCCRWSYVIFERYFSCWNPYRANILKIQHISCTKFLAIIGSPAWATISVVIFHGQGHFLVWSTTTWFYHLVLSSESHRKRNSASGV